MRWFIFLLFSFKIMFEWLHKFIFSWYSDVFHLAVSNVRLGFGFGFILVLAFVLLKAKKFLKVEQ